MGEIDWEMVGGVILVCVILTVIVVGIVILCQRTAAIRGVEKLAAELVQLRRRVKEQDFELKLHKETGDGPERQRRVYYQNIVYAVAREFDKLLQRKPGEGLVCGTIESPASRVEEFAGYLVREVMPLSAVRTRLIMGFPPPITGDVRPNYFAAHMPGFMAFEPEPPAPFTTRAEFQALPALGRWRALPRFNKFVQNVDGTQTLLSAHMEDGSYVVGTLNWPVPESWLEKPEDVTAIKAQA